MQSLIRITALLISASLLLSGCGQTNVRSEIAQTPVTENPSNQSYPGKFIWHDLITPDPQLAGQFYQDLFGWEIDYQGDYAVIRNRGKLIAGMLTVPATVEQDNPAIWLPSVSVDDIDLSAQLVTDNGGTILKGPADMGLRGQGLLVRDPQQTDLVLLDTQQADPADSAPNVGDWLWDEVWTTDPEASETFYAAVLGYDQVVSEGNYDVLIRDTKWRAGIRTIKDDRQHQRWVPVVRVADPHAITQQVSALGGTVWISPENAPNQGETALISDPTGALLLIQRWSPAAKGGR